MNDLSRSLRPMTFRDILNQSIQIYRSDLAKFIGIVLLIKGPYLILGYIVREFFPGSEGYVVQTIILFSHRVLGLLFIDPLLIAAMTIAISYWFLGIDTGIIEAYKKVMKRFLLLLGTMLLTGIVISSVLLTCIYLGYSMLVSGVQAGMLMILIGLILAVVLWIWYLFIAQTVVLEAEGGLSAMKRSKYLVKDYFRKTLVLAILVFLGITLITMLVSLGTGKVLYLLGRYGKLLSAGASIGISNVLSILLEPFRIAVIALLYYDLRTRKEGFDLAIMAEELQSIELGE